ncbi:hypothetical protein [Fuerstiella marisgermanici]|uniref:Uncharacterized protein n=1 Tax=Fuerstiella marisgermanici TaxID=1891926 RepID=A0A1P8WKF0_9PLAN|nr:hypothetical protein [Fuerstiella marisgermanici]APZ94518.1 hypothetical protein Fuma_04150 [Fuerstiella marisgermanici]
MNQHTDLRIHLKLQPEAAAKLIEFQDELHSRLQAAFSDWLVDDPDNLRIVTCHPVIDDEIQITWHIDDVHEVRSDLTDDQAWTVLQDIKRHHDAGIGINWHVIENAAERLYGESPDA